MPTTEKTVTKIECDNPKCPGTDLKTNDREGWLFVTSEVYGQPTQQHVYCSTKCAAADAAAFEAPAPEAEPKAKTK